MRGRNLWVALLMFMVLSPVAVTAAEGEVARAVFTSQVADREPVDSLKQVPADMSRVYFYTDLRGMAGQTVTHRWEHGGRVMAEVTFDVKGPRWRIWSSKTLMPAWQGKWTVSVVDGSGQVLASDDFDYGAAPE